jgi:hypothetical protein
MKMDISAGDKIYTLSKSLECQSIIQKDENQNSKFSGISLFINDKFSEWLLKTIDPEFK